MNPKRDAGETAAVECVVVKINRLPRARGNRNGSISVVDGRRGGEIYGGPTPVLLTILQGVRVKS